MIVTAVLLAGEHLAVKLLKVVTVVDRHGPIECPWRTSSEVQTAVAGAAADRSAASRGPRAAAELRVAVGEECATVLVPGLNARTQRHI